ncbi:MAG: hypothetical protein GF411_18615 [Candidatus Lokiarchaeota archaeon]|nr:hypothetical protein [Candidatus Lokiarchaeota archaeon]
MNLRRIASIYCGFVGISMIMLWTMLFATGQIPELQTEFFRIIAHILAEVATAILLLLSAIGLEKKTRWADKIFIFALGALFYTLIASPGYYIHFEIAPIAVMFFVLLIIDLVFLYIALFNTEQFD